ncbi:MAG: two pore domain potassium channel family protein [Chloroflexi bacterium]|nr:MAG: two pore domain potassium channel family protein [Chloroflexota bacterium]
MDVFIDVVVTIVGLALLAVTLYDLFQSVVLPRPAVNKVQLARIVIRPLWIAWRWIGLRSSRLDRNEARLAAFGPVSLLVLFGIWAFALILAYGLIIYGVRDEFHPVLQDFPESFYVSASTLVPLAYGDFIPEQGFARTVIFFESLTGVALAALAITLLFELYGAFRSREEPVVALDALAGAPASAVQLLETAAAKGMDGILKETFDEWRKWSAMVLESHLAYPLLVYFRRGDGLGRSGDELDGRRADRRRRQAHVHGRQPPRRGHGVGLPPQAGVRCDHRGERVRGRDRPAQGGGLPRPRRRRALAEVCQDAREIRLGSESDRAVAGGAAGAVGGRSVVPAAPAAGAADGRRSETR